MNAKLTLPAFVIVPQWAYFAGCLCLGCTCIVHTAIFLSKLL
jgi:hypothetical protein